MGHPHRGGVSEKEKKGARRELFKKVLVYFFDMKCFFDPTPNIMADH